MLTGADQHDRIAPAEDIRGSGVTAIPNAVKQRLAAEYNLPIDFEAARFQVCRWVSAASAADIEAFITSHRGDMAEDLDGAPVFYRSDASGEFGKLNEIDIYNGAIVPGEHTLSVTLELRGRRIQLVGVDPRTYMRREERPWALADPRADLRILLCHFPRIVDFLPAGTFDLILSGHMHDGQICIPYGRGKVRIAHPWAPYNHGIYRRPGGVLHVSSGLGTTFVPFRFFARPEATELVLESE